MSQEQQQFEADDVQPDRDGAVQQQQQQPQPEGHAGRGSDSIIEQLREWEQRRASNSIGKRRQHPN